MRIIGYEKELGRSENYFKEHNIDPENLDLEKLNDEERKILESYILLKCMLCLTGQSMAQKDGTEISDDEKLGHLADYIIKHEMSCPLDDNCGMDFENKCVGYGEPGCKECMIQNTDKLR